MGFERPRGPASPTDSDELYDEVDYRFSLANERTFLAWIRTALALTAGGLGAVHLLPEFTGREAVGLILLGLGFVVAATSYRRWSQTESAMRHGDPLPRSRLPRLVAVGSAAVGLLAATLVVVDALT